MLFSWFCSWWAHLWRRSTLVTTIWRMKECTDWRKASWRTRHFCGSGFRRQRLRAKVKSSSKLFYALLSLIGFICMFCFYIFYFHVFSCSNSTGKIAMLSHVSPMIMPVMTTLWWLQWLNGYNPFCDVSVVTTKSMILIACDCYFLNYLIWGK